MSTEIVYKTTVKKAERNNSHTLAREFVNDCGSKLDILEVGCASGYFGLALREDGHQVKCIEPYEPAAREAISAGLDVLIGTFEDYCKQFPDQRFDVITFGDVLEHLADPEEALRASLMRLKAGGHVVCSIPNVAHISVRALLLEGRWEYKKTGILDQTHLRFFCRDQFEKLVSSAGFEVESIQAVRLSAQATDKMFDLNLSEPMVSAVEKLRSNDTALDVFQFVYCLRPVQNGIAQSANVPGRILVVADLPEGTHTDIRIRRALNRLERISVTSINYISYHKFKTSNLQGVNVVVFQRPYTELHCKVVDRVRHEGIPYVYEVDDLIVEPPEYSEASKIMRPAKSRILHMMANASLVTVSTERLASELKNHCKKIAVVPNTPAALPEEKHIRYDPTKSISFVVASSDTVPVDILAAALDKLKKAYPNQFTLHAIGPISRSLKKALGFPAKQHPVMPREQFISCIASIPNAVLLIPLDEGRFNACKSSIKFEDCASAGVVVLASDVEPYMAAIQDGVSGRLIDNQVDSWFAAMDELLRNPMHFLRLQPSELVRKTFRTEEDMARDWAHALASLTSAVMRPSTALVVERGALVVPPLGKVMDELVGNFRQMNRKRIQKRRTKISKGA